MSFSIGDFCDELGALGDVDLVWQHTTDFAYDLGFSGCSLTLARKRPGGLQPALLRSDLANTFQTAYLDEGLIKQDPFLLFCCNSLSAKWLGTHDLSDFPGAAPAHQAFLDQISDVGTTGGIGVPARTWGEDMFGGWIFSTSETSVASETLMREKSTATQLAAILAYERMVVLGLGQVAGTEILSERERECLLWLCSGLRVATIADKLLISESAVNLYISNAKRKLGARTREQAIARAILSGEIML